MSTGAPLPSPHHPAPPPHHPPPAISNQKESWPELVGELATLAALQIAHERPDVFVEVLPPGTQWTLPGYNSKRVRLFINNEGRVDKEPRIG